RSPSPSPFSPLSLHDALPILSFILSRLLFLFLEIAALVGFGWLMFGVAVRGSFGALALITVLGALSFAGLGMLVASRARTIEAVSGLMNLVMLPMWIDRQG